MDILGVTRLIEVMRNVMGCIGGIVHSIIYDLSVAFHEWCPVHNLSSILRRVSSIVVATLFEAARSAYTKDIRPFP